VTAFFYNADYDILVQRLCANTLLMTNNANTLLEGGLGFVTQISVSQISDPSTGR